MNISTVVRRLCVCILVLLCGTLFSVSPAQADYIGRNQPSQVISLPKDSQYGGYGKIKLLDVEGKNGVAVHKDNTQTKVELFDTETGEILRTWDVQGATSIDMDGDSFLVNANGQKISLFNINESDPIVTWTSPPPGISPPPGYTRPNIFLNSAVKDGNLVAIPSSYAVYVYDISKSTTEPIWVFPNNPRGKRSNKPDFDGIALDGTTLVVGFTGGGSEDGTPTVGNVSVYDLTSDSEEPSQILYHPSNIPPFAMKFGTKVAIEGDVVVVRAESAILDSTQAYDDIQFRIDGFVYSASSGELKQRLERDPMPADAVYPQSSIDIDIDKDVVLIGSTNGGLHLYSLSSGQVVQSFKPPSPTNDSNFKDSGMAGMSGGNVFMAYETIGLQNDDIYTAIAKYSVEPDPETCNGSTSPQPEPKVCPASYIRNPINGHCYGLTEVTTWSDAQREAEAVGGDLVTINNRAEQGWLLDTFADQVTGGDTGNVWIGLTDIGHKDSYQWISGEPVTFTDWYDGLWSEPDNNGLGQGLEESYVDMCVNLDGVLCFDVGAWGDREDTFPKLQGIVEIP